MSKSLNIITEAKKKFDEIISQQSEKVKEELFEALETVVKLNDSVVEAGLGNVIHSEPKFAKLLKKLGLKLDVEPKEDSQTPSRVSDDQILEFIGDEEKSAGDLEAKFGCSYQTANKKLKALESAKKLSSRKDGVKRLYKRKS
jgi:DNA-binding transcriptional ArsR family regulator